MNTDADISSIPKKKTKPDIPYKTLTSKKKALVGTMIFRFVYEFYKKTGKIPEERDFDVLSHKIHSAVRWRGIRISYEDFYQKPFTKKIARAIKRVQNGEEYVKPLRNDKTKKEKTRSKKKQTEPEPFPFEQDEYFYFIAGYTSGGAPYGITWEQEAEDGLLDDYDDNSDDIDIEVF